VTKDLSAAIDRREGDPFTGRRRAEITERQQTHEPATIDTDGRGKETK
jgi:hypothetical protein